MDAADQSPSKHHEAPNHNKKTTLAELQAANIALLESRSSDDFLETLVAIVNKAGLEFGVTLTVGGAQIAGVLTSGRRYFEHMAETFEERAGIRGAFDRWLARYPAMGANTDQDEGLQGTATHNVYLHLRDVRVYQEQAGALPTGTGPSGVYWRGRISAVDGFIFGQLGPGPTVQ